MTKIEIMRRELGITQGELAEKIGLSQQYLCDIEKERCKPSFNAACKIANVLCGEKYTLDDVKSIMM